MQSNETNPLPARQAVRAVLDEGGVEILVQPRRMASFVLDTGDDDDRIVRIVAHQINEELLEPLILAAQKPDELSMETARDRTIQLLVDGRSLEPQAAARTADALVGGVADSLGLSLSPLPEPEPPQPVDSPQVGKNTKDDPQPTTSADTFDTTRADPDRMPDQVYGPTSSVVQQPVMQQPLAQPQLPTKQQPPAWLVGLVAMLACIVVALAVVILTDSNAETPQDDSAQTQQESTDEAEDAEPEPDQEPEPKADPPAFTEATCSSEIPPDGYSDSYSSYNVLSDDTQHAWNAESSEGEWIQVAADSKQTVEGFSIMPGYIKREDVYYKNSRPKEIEIELSDGYTQTVSLKDNYRKEQRIDFDKAHETTYIKIYVRSVYWGNKYDDLCISRIKPY